MLLAELAARIRGQREKRGLKQTDIAHALQISPQAVSKWERGENAPDIAVLPTLAKLLDVSVDWLLGVNAQERDVFQATVLATGVRGARQKSAALAPKDFAAWSNAFCFQATEAVLRFDGVPVKSMGPGILAFFSGNNHERRAIEAALSFRSVCDQPIKAAACSGRIYLGSMGHPSYAHPDIMGEAVSLALLAIDWGSGHTQGGIVAAAATAKAAGRAVKLGPLQTVELEGIGHPVELVEVLPKN